MVEHEGALVTADESKEFTVDLADDGSGAIISGTLRLMSPLAYEEVLEPVKQRLTAAAGTFTLDLRGLTFMNSSGITGLSRIVLLARQKNKDLTVMLNDSLAWQKKIVTSLQKLYPRLSITTA